jgi:hypothetical protein
MVRHSRSCSRPGGGVASLDLISPSEAVCEAAMAQQPFAVTTNKKTSTPSNAIETHPTVLATLVSPISFHQEPMLMKNSFRIVNLLPTRCSRR